MKKYKVTWSINESWTGIIEAENEEEAERLAEYDEYTSKVYNRNLGKFGIEQDIEEIKE